MAGQWRPKPVLSKIVLGEHNVNVLELGVVQTALGVPLAVLVERSESA